MSASSRVILNAFGLLPSRSSLRRSESGFARAGRCGRRPGLLARFVLLTTLLLSACGYTYAERMDTRRPAPAGRPPAVVPRPVARPPADPLETAHQHGRTAATPADMAGHAFRIRLVDPLNDASQLIHCTSGKAAHFDRRTPAPGLVDALGRTGVPLGVWYLRVDPTGRRTELPNAAWYEHLRRHHRVELIGRNPEDGTVLYRYLGPR